MHGSRVRYIVLRTESPERTEPDAAPPQKLFDASAPRKLLDALAQTIVGQREALRALVLGLIAGGHVLLEGPPGLAKTLACRVLASACDGSFKRIQFTPDLLPSDITGTRVFDQRTAEFRTQLGPIFANIVLADEINRAPAKVQAALLEALQERQVTIAFENHVLPDPFLVLATMNSNDSEGTYPLPLAQMDRFLLNVRLKYPSYEEEHEILRRFSDGDPPLPRAIVSVEELRTWQKAACEIILSDEMHHSIVRIVLATRPHETLPSNLQAYVDTGAGPRASLAMAKLARARAFVDGRSCVDASDIQNIASSVLRHRVAFNYRVQTEKVDIDELMGNIIASA
jgi:MoxR-like ATPase